jgi:hypothetical protein
MTCSQCEKEFTEGIGQLCRRCYNKEWEAKHPHRKKLNMGTCSVCGESPITSRGLCAKHYARWLRHGSTDQTRPETWGTIEKHPLLSQWRWMHRSNTGEVCKRWTDDFMVYVADVGDRPSERHYLRQIDPSLPYGPENFAWVEKKVLKESTESYKEYARRYQREYRKTGIRNLKNTVLKRQYGITIDDYEALHDSQNGKCAICGEKEKAVIRGRGLSLAVDHCHEKGNVRGLLCHRCNKALGEFKDSPTLLRKAADYLERM